MTKTQNTLRLLTVTVENLPGYDVGLAGASLSLDRGHLGLVMLERPNFRTPLADLAGGLLEPDSGAVEFLGRDWQRCLPSRAARMRGLIGRVFEGQNWISNLNVDENVLLQQRHRGRMSEEELLAQATALAITFGLSELPATRPAVTSPHDLKRSACVRAFLGEPCLLLLERPTHGFEDLFEPVLAEVEKAPSAGRPCCGSPISRLKPTIPDSAPTVRFAMSGASLQLLDGMARTNA